MKDTKPLGQKIIYLSTSLERGTNGGRGGVCKLVSRDQRGERHKTHTQPWFPRPKKFMNLKVCIIHT